MAISRRQKVLSGGSWWIVMAMALLLPDGFRLLKPFEVHTRLALLVFISAVVELLALHHLLVGVEARAALFY